MKIANVLLKLVAAAAAIAGIAYLVVKYYGEIKAWIQKFCPCCALEDDFEEETKVDEIPAEEPAEEAEAADEDADEDETVPVADDADFVG